MSSHIVFLLWLEVVSCSCLDQAISMGLPVEISKVWKDGTTEFKLRGGDIEVTVYSLGGIIQSDKAPDKDGILADVVLGYDTPQEYGAQYVGGLIGRYSNRVANGKFSIDGKEYQLNTNHMCNHVHGGLVGFDRKQWGYEISDTKLILSYTSVDGEENYPGTLKAKVTYEVTDDSTIVINYSATTDQPTIVSLSNHAFFNLEGHDKGSLLNHTVQLACSEYTPLDDTRIPYGDVSPVENTDYDFREGRLLTDELLNNPKYGDSDGFDVNVVINGESGAKNFVGRLSGGGRILDTYTTHPAMHFYTAYALSVPDGKDGATYGRCSALCMFCNAYPDSPNKPQFPQAVLRPGEEYNHTTWFQFLKE